jgi:hypothetical protein
MDICNKQGKFSAKKCTFGIVGMFIALFVAGCVSPYKSGTGLEVDDSGLKVDPFYNVPDLRTEQIYDEAYPDAAGDVVTSRSLHLAPHLSSGPTSQTVIALLGQAKRQQENGYPERAAAVLERALRIEPKNAQLWHRLALLRLQQGQLALAESLAVKSNVLANKDIRLTRKNQTIIQQARILQGKTN